MSFSEITRSRSTIFKFSCWVCLSNIDFYILSSFSSLWFLFDNILALCFSALMLSGSGLLKVSLSIVDCSSNYSIEEIPVASPLEKLISFYFYLTVSFKMLIRFFCSLICSSCFAIWLRFKIDAFSCY